MIKLKHLLKYFRDNGIKLYKAKLSGSNDYYRPSYRKTSMPKLDIVVFLGHANLIWQITSGYDLQYHLFCQESNLEQNIEQLLNGLECLRYQAKLRGIELTDPVSLF